MQLSQLETLVAIQKSGSFSVAAERVHLSHSAVSVQMKLLEEELGAVLFIKGRRPATLTATGHIYCEKARDILAGIDELRRLGEGDSTSGEISIGFVPTTLQTLLPVVLAGLRDRYPELHINVRSGLSADLAREVGGQNLDFALLTAPTAPDAGTRLTEIGREPLFLVAPLESAVPARPLDLLRQAPYIAFARSTLLGTQIEAGLLELGLVLRPAIELDSIDAIEDLVAGGFGNSIVPQRLFAPPLNERMLCLPFAGPEAERRLMLASHSRSNRETLRQAIAGLITTRLDAQTKCNTGYIRDRHGKTI